MSESTLPIPSKISGREARVARWRGLLEEFSHGDLSARVFCLERGVGYLRFRYWRRRLGYNFRDHARLQRKLGKRRREAIPRFVRLTPDILSPQHGRSWDFEMTFPNGIVFRGSQALALSALDRIRQRG